MRRIKPKRKKIKAQPQVTPSGPNYAVGLIQHMRMKIQQEEMEKKFGQTGKTLSNMATSGIDVEDDKEEDISERESQSTTGFKEPDIVIEEIDPTEPMEEEEHDGIKDMTEFREMYPKDDRGRYTNAWAEDVDWKGLLSEGYQYIRLNGALYTFNKFGGLKAAQI